MRQLSSHVVGCLALAIACSQSACRNAGDGPEVCEAPQPVPGAEWPQGAPEQYGIDPNALQAAADYAGSHSSQCMVVIRHGVLVGEWYWQGTTPETPIQTWSLAKSYTSSLVGLALQDKVINSVDDPVSRYVPQWQGTGRDGIHIQHLLSMTSGLMFDLTADSVDFFTVPDMTAQALALEPADPAGSIWQYSNQAVQIFEPVLRNATGMAPDVYAQERLWGPLGMTATWQKDAVGDPAMYMNVLTSCRDHARFGQLLLRKGCWGSRRILDTEWVAEATQPSQTLNRAYGWLWWLNAGAPVLDSVTFKPEPTTSYHPYAPPDAFCASGLGSQMIEVIPSLDLVVVRAGYAPQDDPALANNPIAELDATYADGKQIVHNGVLQRVLAGISSAEPGDGGTGPDTDTSLDAGANAAGDAGIAETADAGLQCGPVQSWGTVCPAGQVCSLSAQCTGPQYTAASGTVTDGVTGLIWQQAAPANPCPRDGTGGCTLADAQAYCSGLSLGGYTSGWRLPSLTELYSIVQPGAGSPVIDQTVFAGTPPRWFWTSSSYAGSAGTGWVVYFYDGGTGYLDGDDVSSVRCVRVNL